MSLGTIDALAAYSRAKQATDSLATPSGAVGAETAGPGFGDMVRSALTETASALRGAEQASIRQVSGKGDMIDVVTAIGAAESALHTVVAVRDRMISAYNDIMRMQI